MVNVPMMVTTGARGIASGSTSGFIGHGPDKTASSSKATFLTS